MDRDTRRVRSSERQKCGQACAEGRAAGAKKDSSRITESAPGDAACALVGRVGRAACGAVGGAAADVRRSVAGDLGDAVDDAVKRCPGRYQCAASAAFNTFNDTAGGALVGAGGAHVCITGGAAGECARRAL